MNNNQKKMQIRNIGLFLLLALGAFALIITFSSAMSYAVGLSTFRVVCAIITLLSGAYAVYKASRLVMEPFMKDEETL